MKPTLPLPLLALALVGAAGLSSGCAAPALFGYPSWPPEDPAAAGAGGWRQADVHGPAAEGAPAGPTRTSATTAQPPLLGWDGGVVAGPRPGEVVQSPAPSHGLEPSPEGRMHIIELYQRVLDERDALADQVAQLTRSLERAEGELDLAGGDVRSLTQRITALEERQDALAAENAELSARLTTAQIRRLEAEKLLLETRLDRHESRRGAEAGAQAAPAAPAAARGGER